MHAENFFATLHVRTCHNHAAVEAARPQQRRIQNVWSVRRGDQDHTFVRFEAVHLHEQGVQGLFALIMSPAETCSAMPPNRINFIDENDAGRVFLALFKEIAHAACAHANKHFDEVRTRNREERNVGLTGDCARQQSLARARRSHQQHALGNSPPELLKLLRIFQELNNFLQLFLGLVRSGDILERGLLLLRGEQPCAGLAKTQCLVSARLHLPHQEQAEAHQKNQRCGTSFTLSCTALSLRAFVTVGASSFGMVTWNFMFAGL